MRPGCAISIAHPGTLEAGKIADVLVVDGNPLEDLQAFGSVRVVVGGGVIRDARPTSMFHLDNRNRPSILLQHR